MAITNPYIYGHPVREKEMFFGREDVFAFLRDHLIGAYQDNVVMLYGQRRTGKTSILYQILNNNRLGENYVPVLISLEPLGDAETNAQIFWAIASEIALQLHLPPPEEEKFDPINRYFCYDFLGKIKTHLNHKKLLLMIDEYEKLEECVKNPNTKVNPTIFSQFRHLMQHYDWISFLWVGSHKLEELHVDYWKEFTGTVYHTISFLDPKSARDLIEQPASKFSVRYTLDAIQRLLELSGDHPLFLQALCHFTYTNSAEKGEITKQDVETAIEPCIEAIRNLYTSIWRDFKDDEKVILAITAHIDTQQINISDIASQLEHFKISWELERIEKAVQQLEHKDALKKTELQQYHYCSLFFRECVKTYQSLGKVLDELNIGRKKDAKFIHDPKVLKAEHYLRDAEQYTRLGDIETAEKTFKYVIETCPDYIDGWLRFGKFYESLERWEDALNLYKTRLEQYPDSVEASNAIGFLLKESSQYAEAILQYMHSLEIQATNILALANINEIQRLSLQSQKLERDPYVRRADQTLQKLIMLYKRTIFDKKEIESNPEDFIQLKQELKLLALEVISLRDSIILIENREEKDNSIGLNKEKNAN